MLRPAAGRNVVRRPGVTSRYSFSFGADYDPANTHFGLLIANNDELLSAGAGFDEHAHRDVEILTWVVSGQLRHTDSNGSTVRIGAGGAAVLYAGSGVRHREVAGSTPTRFVGMWLRLTEPAGPPAFAWVDGLPGSGLVAVAGPGAALPLRQRGASLYLARLAPGESVALAPSEHLHVYAVDGETDLAGVGPLGPGDAARLVGEAARLSARTPASLLVTAMD